MPGSSDPTIVITTGGPGPAAAAFAPGTVLGKRFRIIARIGRGGMGEVYRADDLKLGTEVALKFLPTESAFDQKWLDRLRAEVRVARELSHPNLCRVYDLDEVDLAVGEGEAGGAVRTLHFISMEYIDGEDLGSLLRRIGRLPKDKAAQVARQLCAGLAAAHAAGVLHRDLKPANIMLDGRGQAKIGDFGIAGYIGEIAGGDVRSGTPEYMAPEQLSGREVSPRSDLYALGLVLHELFTGHKAGEPLAPGTPAPEPGTRTASSLKRPSSFVDDLDPAVERIILRCLADEPHDRPHSALAVAAALPGGDPLQAALEAGETPSPELVAAAGPSGAISLGRAALIAGAGAIGLVLIIAFSWRTDMVNYLPLPRPPAVLADKAAGMLRELGYGEAPAGVAQGFSITGGGYMNWIRKNDHSPDRFEALRKGRPAVIRFWYRTSPQALVAFNSSGYVTPGDPPMTVPGMTRIELDTLGRLHSFSAVPGPTLAEAGAEPGAAGPDWGSAFRLAELDIGKFEAIAPDFVPDQFADRRAAWSGVFPEHPELPLRVEGASAGARIVWFELLGDWEVKARSAGPDRQPIEQRVALSASVALIMSALAAAVALARRNVRRGRGDRRGATRLSAGILVLTVVVWALETDHYGALQVEWLSFVTNAGFGLFVAGTAWILYVALEPLIRRTHPHLVVSWARLLAGKHQDPVVGRDILMGLSTACVVGAAFRAVPVVEALVGRAPTGPSMRAAAAISSDRMVLGLAAAQVIHAALQSLLLFFLFVALSVLLRKRWLAAGAFFVVASIAFASDEAGHSVTRLAMQSAGLLVLTVMISRLGLLALLSAALVMLVCNTMPLTSRLDAWYAHPTLVALGLIVGLGAWAFVNATRPSRAQGAATVPVHA